MFAFHECCSLVLRVKGAEKVYLFKKREADRYLRVGLIDDLSYLEEEQQMFDVSPKKKNSHNTHRPYLSLSSDITVVTFPLMRMNLTKNKMC